MPDNNQQSALVLRGALVYFIDDPFLAGNSALVHEPDGMVICQGGKIQAVGSANALAGQVPAGAEVRHYPNCLISAGFIDLHVHYVQTGMIGAYGAQLLEWLNNYTFITEQKFADPHYARKVADLFCDQLLANGTTSAMVFCAVYPGSVDALFEAAQARNMRLIAGKVLMDRNAPEPLLDTPQSAYDDSKALIEKWHGQGRQLYAITPRFAPTSSPEQLHMAGTLLKEHPTTFVQTHISENKQEVEWVRQLFPKQEGYLDVYSHYGLVGPRSVLAHGVHLAEHELQSCHDCGAALAHCPTSNLFLGSGLFSLEKAKDPRRPVHVGLGTDIGGGTSFSMLATLNEAYKVGKLQDYALDAIQGLYLATYGGARALRLEDTIGSIQPGLEADLVVLDPNATPLLAFRSAQAESLEEQLFVLMTLGDDRSVKATIVGGQVAYERP